MRAAHILHHVIVFMNKKKKTLKMLHWVKQKISTDIRGENQTKSMFLSRPVHHEPTKIIKAHVVSGREIRYEPSVSTQTHNVKHK